ncbi:MAG: hypothetical protein IPM79_20525 [Polyangiaceae bacterium]|nr:hypothetical protein [Polyangiaceae bacterium]MBK8939940.1 hypothetical protein [Polyangiaceae bacterium]
MLRLTSAAVCLAALLTPSLALAGTAEEEARKAFEEGLAEEQKGLPTACAKFRRSLELTRELGPLVKSKECDVREGKILAAIAKLDEAIPRWPEADAELAALKTERGALEARVARLSLSLRPGAPEGVTARVDAKLIALPSSDLRLDPGDHELLVEVPGRALERVVVTLKDGERREVSLPPPSSAASRAGSGSGGVRALGIAGLVIGGVGIAGLIGGAVTGGMILDKQSAFEACRDGGTPAGCDVLALKQSGEELLPVNGALLIGGAALAVVGGTLLIVDLVTAPASEPQQPAAQLGLELGGGGGRVVLDVLF